LARHESTARRPGAEAGARLDPLGGGIVVGVRHRVTGRTISEPVAPTQESVARTSGRFGAKKHLFGARRRHLSPERGGRGSGGEAFPDILAVGAERGGVGRGRRAAFFGDEPAGPAGLLCSRGEVFEPPVALAESDLVFLSAFERLQMAAVDALRV